MELRLSNSSYNCFLWLCSFALCAIIGMHPVASIEVYTPIEVFVENGTAGVLKCTFKSNQVISSQASVSWSFIPETSSDSTGETIFHYAGGKGFPDSAQFKSRVEWAGDLNKKDGSIRINKMHFNDNGTYSCDVKNPPDIAGKPSQTKLRVVKKESLPQTSPAVIVGAVIGAIIGVIIIAVVAYLLIRVMRSTRDYEGTFHLSFCSFATFCQYHHVTLNHFYFITLVSSSLSLLCASVRASSIRHCLCITATRFSPTPTHSGCRSCTSIESVSTQAAQPGKKAESSTDGSRSSSPSAPVQGPVIYAQLDHSGSKNSFHKMEPVVYADIRKN
ncbi:hypothetical protein QTP86_019165 [Hemibagrus guttatus]|nr:hypothetical protein QTP86_019165 [Hemibagrus guttatus]